MSIGGSSHPLSTQVPGFPSRYHLVVFVLVYFLPLVVMFAAYSIIGLTLWKRAVPRHQAHGANLRHLQAKKKVGRRGGMGCGNRLHRDPESTR